MREGFSSHVDYFALWDGPAYHMGIGRQVGTAKDGRGIFRVAGIIPDLVDKDTPAFEEEPAVSLECELARLFINYVLDSQRSCEFGVARSTPGLVEIVSGFGLVS